MGVPAIAADGCRAASPGAPRMPEFSIAARRGAPTASDPTGGLTLYDAVNKQLGLKLEMQKRSMPVLVIDHIEEKPADN